MNTKTTALLAIALLSAAASAEENYIESTAGAGAVPLGMLDLSREGRADVGDDLDAVLEQLRLRTA